MREPHGSALCRCIEGCSWRTCATTINQRSGLHWRHLHSPWPCLCTYGGQYGVAIDGSGIHGDETRCIAGRCGGHPDGLRNSASAARIHSAQQPAGAAPAGAAPRAPATPPAAPLPPSPAQQAQAQKTAMQVVELLEAGNEDQATVELRRALELDPNNKLALNLMRQITADPQATLGRESFAYTVRPSDTLSRIAGRYLGDIYAFYILARYNGIQVPKRVSSGQVIRIPGKAPPPGRTAARPAPQQPPSPAPAPAPAAAPAPSAHAAAPAATPSGAIGGRTGLQAWRGSRKSWPPRRRLRGISGCRRTRPSWCRGAGDERAQHPGRQPVAPGAPGNGKPEPQGGSSAV